jgi:Ulp1 family protease
MDKKNTPFDYTGWTIAQPKNIPAQENGYDCGVFTCIFAEYSSRGEPFDFSQSHMKYFRQRLIYEISQAELLIR